MYEHDFYNIEKEIAAYNNITLPEKLKLDFKEPEYPKTVQDQIMLDEHRLLHHMVDEAGLLMEYNDDLTRKEAEKIIEQNKEKTEKLSIFDKVRQQSEEATGLQGGVQQREDTGDNTQS